MKLISGDYSIQISQDFYEIDNSSGDIYLSILIPLYWTQHKNNCDDCSSFFRKLENSSNDDWFSLYEDKYYRLEFLDNQFIGNGIDTIMVSKKIDLMKTDISNINLNHVYKIENIKMSKLEDSTILKRNEILNCLLSESKSKTTDVYISSPFKQIPKELAEKIINNSSTIEISSDEILSMDLKIEIKKK